MKKALSVLLIAAALFGFYGGAISLNDVLACKDYWEEEGERSTADMNKLEDGLNQLKDNEQAYLDGQDQLAEGEKTLADGEAALADGERQLAEGEASYAAAPGKLAAGEKKLAKGKKDLSDLDKLISGLKSAKNGYDNQWHPGFAKKDPKNKDMGLEQARQVMTGLLNQKEDLVNLVGSPALADNKDILNDVNNADSYAQFDKAVNNLIRDFGKASEILKGFAQLAKNKADDQNLTKAYAGLMGATKTTAEEKQKIQGMTLSDMKDGTEAVTDGVNGAIRTYGLAALGLEECENSAESFTALKEKVDTLLKNGGYPDAAEPALKGISGNLESGLGLYQLIGARAAVQEQVGGLVKQLGDKLDMVKKLDPQAGAAADKAIGTLTTNGADVTNADYAAAINNTPSETNPYPGLKQILLAVATKLDNPNDEENPGYVQQLNGYKEQFEAWDSGYDQLKDGKDQMANNKGKDIPFAFTSMLESDTIMKALRKKAPSVIPTIKKYKGTTLNKDDLDEFDTDMGKVSKAIKKILPVLYAVKKDGRAQVKAGQAELNQGYADYAAAPGKLADARQQLADGRQQLADGRQALADGKAKLAEYEDGEQQVRDGLATLMGTEPNGGLQSILDRRNGDDDFDNGDKHLDLDEGLEAVTVGRGYQADSGELITKEITGRAIGTAAGLGAGALAVLAAILSFLKKNKGAGVSAILSAAAGGAAVAVGTGAGTEFSSIAGSLVGATPWIAFGILGGVALVHAIAHFASKAA